MTLPLAQMGRDVNRRMGRLDAAVKRTRPRAVQAGALAAKDTHAAAIRRDAGSDMRMSGVGKRGRKVGVRYDKKGEGAVVRATGPLHLLDRDTDAHRIPKKRGRRARRRYAVIPGVGVRAYARHPGTRGKRTWTRAVPKAQAESTKVVRSTMSEALQKAR